MDESFLDFSASMDDYFLDYDNIAAASDSSEFSDSAKYEEDALNFAPMPFDLQCCVISKFELREFSRFEQTSRLAKNACHEQSCMIPVIMPLIYVNKKTIKASKFYGHEIDSIKPLIPYRAICQSPVRIEAASMIISGGVTSGRIRKAAKLFEENQTTAKGIKLLAPIKYKPEDLNYLLKVTSPKTFTCTEFISQQFFQHEAIQKIHMLRLGNTGCTDDELLKLNGDVLFLRSDFVTARGVNKFMKQWKRMEREVFCVCIKFGPIHVPQNFDTILEGLDANPVWTPETHSDGILGSLPLESIYPIRTRNPEHVYSMWSPENTERRLIISLSRKGVRLDVYYNEEETLHGWLSDDGYYLLTKKCRHCEKRFCHHRRRIRQQN